MDVIPDRSTAPEIRRIVTSAMSAWDNFIRGFEGTMDGHLSDEFDKTVDAGDASAVVDLIDSATALAVQRFEGGIATALKPYIAELYALRRARGAS